MPFIQMQVTETVFDSFITVVMFPCRENKVLNHLISDQLIVVRRELFGPNRRFTVAFFCDVNNTKRLRQLMRFVRSICSMTTVVGSTSVCLLMNELMSSFQLCK